MTKPSLSADKRFKGLRQRLMSPHWRQFFKTYRRKNPSSLCRAIFTPFSPPYLNLCLCDPSPHYQSLTLTPSLHLPHPTISFFSISTYRPPPRSHLPPHLSFLLPTPTRKSRMALSTSQILVLRWHLLQSLLPYGDFLTITTCMSLSPLQISTTRRTRNPLSALVSNP